MKSNKNTQKNKSAKDNKATKQEETSATETQDAPVASSKRKIAAENDDELSIKGFWRHYSRSTDTHTKMIDLFILYLLILISCQLFYRFVVGDDFPRNAFVSGIFCPLGVAVLLVILRGRGRDFKQLGEFFLACLVLFITAINFAG